MTTAELKRVPFIPHETLKAHQVLEFADDRFRAAARVRQALLREEKGWSIGMWSKDGRPARPLGSYLAEDHNDANFITTDIAQMVRKEVAWREDDALIDQDRLYRNLLSSMPVTFNLLGALKLRPRLATNVMRRICPSFVQKVDAILFEHSPGRRHPKFTMDRTAFDALLKVSTTKGENGFIGVEVKYTESLHEQPADLRPRYDELSSQSGLFVEPDHPALRTAPLQQLWRQHLLCFAMVSSGLYTKGRFIVIAPDLNRSAQGAISMYRTHLRDDCPVPFDAISLERMVRTIDRAGGKDVAALLHERYVDFSAVDALI